MWWFISFVNIPSHQHESRPHSSCLWQRPFYDWQSSSVLDSINVLDILIDICQSVWVFVIRVLSLRLVSHSVTVSTQRTLGISECRKYKTNKKDLFNEVFDVDIWQDFIFWGVSVQSVSAQIILFRYFLHEEDNKSIRIWRQKNLLSAECHHNTTL